MPAPTMASTPTAAQLNAMPCPVARAKLITDTARTVGTLPRWAAAIRVAALREARAAGKTVVWLAAQLNVSHARISTLTRTTGEA